MTWEDAVRKYKAHSPTADMNLTPLAGRPLSPAPHSAGRPNFKHEPQDMDIDSPPAPPNQEQQQQQQQQHPQQQQLHQQPQQQQPPPSLPPPANSRLSLSETRLRTPLPSGRGLEKIASTALPGIDSMRTDLQNAANRISSTIRRGRYVDAKALLLYWHEELDSGVRASVRELAHVLEKQYNYTFDISPIPVSSDECKSSWRWLSRKINEFVENRDERDVLKIVYYNGYSFLDGNREMVLSR